MDKSMKIIVSLLVTIGVLVALGVLALRVGGVSIRSASQTYEMGKLEVVNTVLLPGVPITVGITIESLEAIKASPMLLLRLSTETTVIDEITYDELSRGRAMVVLPCNSRGGEKGRARLVLIDGDSQEVLAQSEQLTILAPGPDCI